MKTNTSILILNLIIVAAIVIMGILSHGNDNGYLLLAVMLSIIEFFVGIISLVKLVIYDD